MYVAAFQPSKLHVRESLVRDIPAGYGTIANLFLQCIILLRPQCSSRYGFYHGTKKFLPFMRNPRNLALIPDKFRQFFAKKINYFFIRDSYRISPTQSRKASHVYNENSFWPMLSVTFMIMYLFVFVKKRKWIAKY